MCILYFFFFFKQKTAYEMRISDWSSDVCSSDLSSAVIPEEAFLNIKLGTGGNSETTFQPGLTHYGGGDSDLLGYDDGTRKVSAELKDAIASGHRITPGLNFTSDEVK